MRNVNVITGQTTVGKTSHALRLAQDNNGELISADSRQIYQKLDIITGKDVLRQNFTKIDSLQLDRNRLAHIGYYEIDGVKVWGLDLVDPKLPFSSYDFAIVCKHLLSRFIEVDKNIYLVGGSWLYIKHLIYGFDVTASPQWKLREELAEYSIDELQRKLIKVDKITFESLNESDRYNPHRLIRKIEIATSTKKTPPSVTPLRTKVASIIGLRFAQPKKMKDAITQRVYARLTQGAIQEVKNLLNEGYTKSDPGLQTIGYQQIMSFLSGELTEEQAIEQWIRAEIKYAKRQNTFMKKDDHIIWMER